MEMSNELQQAIIIIKQLAHTELRALHEAVQSRLFRIEIEKKEAVKALLSK